MKKDKKETMMQPTNKVHKKNNRARGRKAEANARRKVAKSWDKIAHGSRYQKAAAKESCRRATKQMEEELFDGILLNLRCKNKVKSYNAQKRILRRIVEKRQAQQAYSKVGRRRDRFSSHIYRHCTSKSMSELRDHQLCA
ncbi:hypothetical protein [Prevotella pectinovora]|uniref:hypothetical protein n=1 Tax=Prevotella pectinovora TaxID=1602169 RepID=UPI000A5B345C|nr:hypothetical protein [Prevotella pectinovora]